MKHFYCYILAFFFLLILSADFCLAENSSAKEIFSIKVGDYTQALSQDEIRNLVQEKSSLVYSPSYLSEIENTDFCKYKKSIICNLLFSFRQNYHIKKDVQRTVDSDKLTVFLDELGKKVNKSPESAKFKFEDNKVSVFSTGSDGLQLNQNKSFEILKNFLEQTDRLNEVDLAFNVLKQEETLDSIENMGITTLIGEGRSNFRGSPKNRIYNIKVAIKKFEGVLIKPDEEFSFVKTLGDVDGEHGYLPELVIKNDKTEPEFGGGICQVSTTTFRAAIYSGLKITARTNHAYPVQYYNPQGMDSTVYIPRPDLRFKNNTGSYILIQPRIEGTELIFDFYGKDTGRKINVIGPKITERNSDGSMKAVFTQQVFDSDENLIFEDVFKSNYDSPDKYPHPGEVLTEKPEDWSKKQWKEYKKAHPST